MTRLASDVPARIAAGSGVALALIVWELCSRVGVVNSAYLPPPSIIAVALSQLAFGGTLLRDLSASLARLTMGYALAIVVGLGAAILCVRFRLLYAGLSPVVELIRGIAPLALLPAFLLVFGIGFQSKVAMILWVAWTPIFVSSLQGMQSVDPMLVKAAQSMGTRGVRLAVRVLLPAAFPHVLSGLRVGFGAALLVLVAAEMLGANDGLGFYILESAQTFHIPQMYAAIVVIGLVGLAVNALFFTAVRRFAPWSL